MATHARALANQPPTGCCAGPPRQVAAYPLVPLFENQGLGIALLSYLDRLYVGLTADWADGEPEVIRPRTPKAFEPPDVF